MKKVFMFLLMLILALNSYSQSNVIKFLGIPVDGSRAKMEKQLKEKGFKNFKADKSLFEGEFNGRKVLVGIKTNKEKVCRVTVVDYDYVNVNQIKIRFNTLYNQFLNNPKYVLVDGKMIDEKEDISYQMTVKHKDYLAGFSQMGTIEEVQNILLNKYTEEQLNNPSKELKKEINNDMIEMIKNNVVWFKIVESEGEYAIAIYYDNMYNFPNGEDL